MYSEIGSDFWEYCINSYGSRSDFFWNNSDYHVQYLKSGRNAIKALCQNIDVQTKRVFVPAYTCETVIQPFLEEGWKVIFYPIKIDMSLNAISLMKLLDYETPDVILFHNYFGFNTFKGEELLKECKRKGIIIVEDLTQSLFSNCYSPIADYYITSFRKYFAIPDGGALISRRRLKEIEVHVQDDELLNVAMEAFSLKRQYFCQDCMVEKAEFREKYAEHHRLIANNALVRNMSSLSMDILNSVEYQEMYRLRRRNYDRLSRKLSLIKDICLVIKEPVYECTPLYLPIYVEKRKELQTFLASNSIFCPVIWPKPTVIVHCDDETKYMYEHMLCIPIDQRYGDEEMDIVFRVIEEYFNNER